MRGKVLYPLNRLRATHPDLYERERSKYDGRSAALLELRIPLLDVLWNDAVHLSPIHPSLLADAWRAAGLSPETWEREFFEIPVDRIDAHRCVWFASGALARDASPQGAELSLPIDDVARFDPASYRELPRPPARYLEYLRSQRERGRRPRPFAYIAHVLVAAPVDVAGLACVRHGA